MSALRIAMVAGETSGDILGAQVIESLKKRIPNLEFEGIGGPRMIEAGFSSWFDMERLAVMGLVEPLKRLPELLSMRKQLKKQWLKHPPDLFLGIDAPDFNLGIETALKAKGIPTAHLVCPTVWAWREGRIKTIAKACDDLLCLFPFEPIAFEETRVQAHFVGHPMVEALEALPSDTEIRAAFNLSDRSVIALLPGSRRSEIELLLPVYLAALDLCDFPHDIVIPASNSDNFELIQSMIASVSTKPIVVTGGSRELLKIADVAVVTSGTATLEAALLECPMVIAYRMSPVSWFFIKRLIKTSFAGLPNIMLDKAIVPELIQENLTPDALAQELRVLMTQGAEKQKEAFKEILSTLDTRFGDHCASVLMNTLGR